MRIVGGTFRGASLQAPKGMKTRPTSDRVRESLFNILTHSIDGFNLEGQRVLDLFAGTGALGFEALSRGASYCLFVDSDAEARGAIRTNIESFGVTAKTRLFRREAQKLGASGTMGQFGLIFLDPPYGNGLAEQALVAARDGGWLASQALCVIEERADVTLELSDGFTPIDQRQYGDTQIQLARFTG